MNLDAYSSQVRIPPVGKEIDGEWHKVQDVPGSEMEPSSSLDGDTSAKGIVVQDDEMV